MAEPGQGARGSRSTWFSMAFLFLGSLTTDSCSSAIFFILLSMSIFCARFLVWFFSSRTVSSLPRFFAKRDAHAEWMAVTQFSRSVWLVAYTQESKSIK